MADYEKLPEGYDLDQRITQSRQQQRQAEGAGYEQLPQGYRLPGTEPTPYEKDWGKASAGEVAKGFVQEALPSLGRQLAAIPQAIMNPSETAAGIKQIGTGIASKYRGAMGEQQAPEQKAQDEAVINAIIEPFTSVAGFKKALATDPFSVLSVMAIPVSGGASAAGAGAKALGTASMAGKALRGAELAGKGAAMAMDPVYGVAKGIGAAYEAGAKPAAKAAISDVSGVSRPAMDLAYEAGRTSDKSLKDAFNTFAKGQGNPVQFSRAVEKASTAMRDAEMSAWKTDKNNILALKTPVDSEPILKAIKEARENIGPRSEAFGTSLQAHRQLDEYERLLRRKLNAPETSPSRNIVSMDMAKRTLYADAKSAGNPMTSNALMTLHNGVRQGMFKVSEDYVRLMEKYQEMLDAMKTVKKSLNTGDNVSAIRELNTFVRGMDDQYKGQFIAELAKYDPRIPYMVAGSTIHQAAGNPSNWGKVLSYGQLANIGYGLHRGDPMHVAGAVGALGAQKVFGSPEAVGRMTYGLGETGRFLGKVGEFVPPGTGAVLSTEARLAPSQLSRMQNEELMESVREGRKTGGRVLTADQLVAEVDRAKKRINDDTKVLLNTPDNHVAQALEVANRQLEG